MAHVVVFFIFLVSNIGGSLTPLGDPPLFLGFLRGVTFFWTLVHLLARDAVRRAVLLALFFALDSVALPARGQRRARSDARLARLRSTALRELCRCSAVVIGAIADERRLEARASSFDIMGHAARTAEPAARRPC